MKKLVLFIALMFTMVISNAQIATLSMGVDETYKEYSTNTTLTNTTAQYFLVNSSAPWYTAQCFVLNLDSLSGNHTNVAVVLAGRATDVTPAWTTISTTNWTGVTSDTTMTVLNATENHYRQFKITLTGTGTGTTRIDNFEFKQYYGLP